MKMRTLSGIESLGPFNIFYMLMFGLNQLPPYNGEKFSDFMLRVQQMPPNEQENIIRLAAVLIHLDPDEVGLCVRFFEDNQGVPYDRTNVRNLTPSDLFEMIIQATKAVASIPINLVTQDEKKN